MRESYQPTVGLDANGPSASKYLPVMAARTVRPEIKGRLGWFPGRHLFKDQPLDLHFRYFSPASYMFFLYVTVQWDSIAGGLFFRVSSLA